MFKYSDTNKKYHTLSYYNKQIFKQKIFKAVINCGFTCPNLDGSLDTKGCIFCHDKSSLFCNSSSLSAYEQFDLEIKRINTKNTKAIAYFQAGSNTYAPLDILKSTFESVLKHKDCVGISIGTRCDCLDTNILNYLQELSTRTHLTVELGLQTTHDKTLKIINRHHTYQEFLTGYNKLKEKNIRVCVHLINSLPYETKDMMIQNAIKIGKLYPDALKIHMLYIIKNTKLQELYTLTPFEILTMDEYTSIVVNQLEYIPDTTVIERITGDPDRSSLFLPNWTTDKKKVMNTIDKKMTFQGKFFTPST